MKIKDFIYGLFSPKEMYQTFCDKNGKLPLIGNLSKHYRRKMEYENLHLIEGAELTEENGFPIIKPYNGEIDLNPIGYSKKKPYKGTNKFVHPFEDDYKWANPMWQNLEKTVHQLRDFGGVYAPDFSLFVDVPKAFNIAQLYKNRLCTYYMQSIGYNVIPTASFGNVDSFSYCYEGLPEKSILAMCGTGLESKENRDIFEYAVRVLEEMKSPTKLIIYGKPFKIEGLDTEIIFIEDEITKHFRNK